MPLPLKSLSIPGLSPLSIARMLWKRKLPIVCIWGVVSIGAHVVVSRIPSMYKAEALILVDSQKIPDKYVASTVVSDAQDRLATISQQILSTGRLEKIIEDFDLYHNERKTLFKEDLVNMMRRDLDTVPERNWNGRTASFRISYQGPDPVVIAQVTNKIATFYVEENLKTREIQAEGTSEFIEAQLKEAKDRLDGLEAAVSQYKVSHNGNLPQQEPSLNGILSRLGTSLEANRDAINRAQQQNVILQNALSTAEDSEASLVRELQSAAAASQNASSVPSISNSAIQTKPRKRSEDLEAQLAELRLHYSDSHPDVRRLRVMIDQVKRQEDQSRAETIVEPAPARLAPNSSVPPGQKPKPVLDSPGLAQIRERIASLKSQLDFTNQELETRKKEQQRIQSDVSLYQEKVNSLPIREQEMAGLTRDYEISKANYRSLLDKKIAAEMATDMERREKSESFKLIDPARVPARPFAPKRTMLNLGGSLFGLVLGLVVGLGNEFKKATLLGEWELPKSTTILGRLPYIEINPGTAEHRLHGDKRRTRKLRLAILSSAVLSLLGIIVAGLYLVSRRF
jgi:polysaccharide chain length determinant protein (PEP-CTERM system associated)